MSNILLQEHIPILLEALYTNSCKLIIYEFTDGCLLVSTMFNRYAYRFAKIKIVKEKGLGENPPVFYDFQISSYAKCFDITNFLYVIEHINQVYTTFITLLNKKYKEDSNY